MKERGSLGWVRRWTWVAALGLLLVAFGLALNSARVKSATFDEDAYIGKGVAIWKESNYWLRTAHPALAPMLNTLPLLLEPEVTPPTDHPCWPDGSGRSCGRVMLFSQGDTRRTLLLARLPTMFLTLVLAAVAYRWARDLFGPLGGLEALALCALDPNLLAHGRLITLDLATTFFFFLTFFTLYRFWRRPGWGRLILAGLVLGGAGATRYTAGTLLPPFVLLSLARAWRPVRSEPFPGLAAPSRWRRLMSAVLLLLAMGVIAAITVWIIHGADFGPVPRWDGIQLPAPTYFNDLAALWEYRDKPQDAFLLGRHYEGGWWPYFVVAFFIKTPLPTILLIVVAVADLIRRRDGRFGEAILLIYAGYHFGLSVVNPFNIGYRHLLPMLPPLCVFAGRAVCSFARASRRWLRYVPLALLGWLAIANLAICPHYLAYFNELVGPRNGYRVLVDSNIDWGQDLPALERYVTEHDVDSLYLSWFGESRPSQYAIPYRSIPSKPDELSDIYTRVYHPDYPPPGRYAISATNLQGLLFDDKDLFAWFLQRDPVAQPGYSILVYEVPRLLDADAPSVAVALGSRQIDQVPALVFEDFWRTNDLQLRWFDAVSSCVLPADGDVWYVLPGEAGSAPPPCPLWEASEALAQVPTRDDSERLALYHVQASPEGWLADTAASSPLLLSDEAAFAPGEAPDLRHQVSPPLRFGDNLELMGYRALSDAFSPGSDWSFVSYWRVVAPGSEQLKLFAQVLDDGGGMRAQFDGLDIPVIGWQVGDLLIQQHTLSLPEDLAPGRYWVQLGVYGAQTKQRLEVRVGEAAGTRVLLPPMEVR